MNRRNFIKTLLNTTLAGLAVITLPIIRASASLNPSRGYLISKRLGRSFQGTVDGQLLESLDEDQTWRHLFNFGSHVSVLGMYERQGSLYLELGVQRFSFFLKSPDGRVWLTTAAIPAL
jgi:hypothetical protein